MRCNLTYTPYNLQSLHYLRELPKTLLKCFSDYLTWNPRPIIWHQRSFSLFEHAFSGSVTLTLRGGSSVMHPWHQQLRSKFGMLSFGVALG